MSRNALQIFQAEDPQGFLMLELAAQLSRSEKVPPLQRAVLLIEISNTMAPYLVKAAAESFEPVVDPNAKPKYTWVNGARVKIK